MGMTIDQIERDMEIAYSDLKNVSRRFYKLGYEKAKLEVIDRLAELEDGREAHQVNENPESRNCPFCGGAAKAYAVYMGECDSTRTVKTYGVQCAGCGVRYDAIFPSAEDAIAAWNLRAKEG